jgi:biopolymer transport protein ExbB/TolQ
MNLLGPLENGLFALGQVLRFPVMALLWVCVLAVLFMAGSAVVEALARRRERRGFDVEAWLKQGRVLGVEQARRAQLPVPLERLLADVERGRSESRLADGGLEHLVLANEERTRRTLSGSRLLVKVGPSLGLLGTLIPMGTALAALATGNLDAMAGQMVVAFTTTIVGLASGTIAYVVQVVRHSWVNQTVREQRFLAERVAAEIGSTVSVEDEFVGAGR